jgi:hypothetical protein
MLTRYKDPYIYLTRLFHSRRKIKKYSPDFDLVQVFILVEHNQLYIVIIFYIWHVIWKVAANC